MSEKKFSDYLNEFLKKLDSVLGRFMFSLDERLKKLQLPKPPARLTEQEKAEIIEAAKKLDKEWAQMKSDVSTLRTLVTYLEAKVKKLESKLSEVEKIVRGGKETQEQG